jgi:hypothetical protein
MRKVMMKKKMKHLMFMIMKKVNLKKKEISQRLSEMSMNNNRADSSGYVASQKLDAAGMCFNELYSKVNRNYVLFRVLISCEIVMLTMCKQKRTVRTTLNVYIVVLIKQVNFSRHISHIQ